MKPFELEGYTTKLLDRDDTGSVQQLCIRCADYFDIVEGTPPPFEAGSDILESLPPGMKPGDKSVIGFFNSEGELAALADLIDGYPEKGTWMLGLLLIDPEERKKGMGRRIHSGLTGMAAASGASRLRIGVVEDNANALGFWTHLGYSETGRVSRRYGTKDHTVIIMECVL